MCNRRSFIILDIVGCVFSVAILILCAISLAIKDWIKVGFSPKTSSANLVSNDATVNYVDASGKLTPFFMSFENGSIEYDWTNLLTKKHDWNKKTTVFNVSNGQKSLAIFSASTLLALGIVALVAAISMFCVQVAAVGVMLFINGLVSCFILALFLGLGKHGMRFVNNAGCSDFNCKESIGLAAIFGLLAAIIAIVEGLVLIVIACFLPKEKKDKIIIERRGTTHVHVTKKSRSVSSSSSSSSSPEVIIRGAAHACNTTSSSSSSRSSPRDIVIQQKAVRRVNDTTSSSSPSSIGRYHTQPNSQPGVSRDRPSRIVLHQPVKHEFDPEHRISGSVRYIQPQNPSRRPLSSSGRPVRKPQY